MPWSLASLSLLKTSEILENIQQNLQCIAPCSSIGPVKIRAGREGDAAAHFPTVVLWFHSCGKLVEGSDGWDGVIKDTDGNAVMGDLEKAPGVRGFPDLVDDLRSTVGVSMGEIDGGDEMEREGLGELKGLRWVDEEAWDGGGARVGEPFASNLGLVKFLHFLGSIVFEFLGSITIHSHHLLLLLLLLLLLRVVSSLCFLRLLVHPFKEVAPPMTNPLESYLLVCRSTWIHIPPHLYSVITHRGLLPGPVKYELLKRCYNFLMCISLAKLYCKWEFDLPSINLV